MVAGVIDSRQLGVIFCREVSTDLKFLGSEFVLGEKGCCLLLACLTVLATNLSVAVTNLYSVWMALRSYILFVRQNFVSV